MQTNTADSTFRRGEERRDIPSYAAFASKWLGHNNADNIKYSTDSIADSDAETDAWMYCLRKSY